MKRKPTPRRKAHLDRGEAVFIPPERLAKVKWEEAVLRSQAKREGREVVVHHSTCHCGSIDCVGVPVNVAGARRRTKK